MLSIGGQGGYVDDRYRLKFTQTPLTLTDVWICCIQQIEVMACCA